MPFKRQPLKRYRFQHRRLLLVEQPTRALPRILIVKPRAPELLLASAVVSACPLISSSASLLPHRPFDLDLHVEEIYRVEVSPSLISSVTDGVIDEVRCWQSRPAEILMEMIMCTNCVDFVT